MKKKIIISILIFILILFAGLIYLNESLKPLPENKRNISTKNVKALVYLEDKANRTPILRTYTREEFEDFDENKIKRIKKIVNGNIEGDIPALTILDGIGKLGLSFEMIDEDSISTKIIPDDIPKIKISVPYSKEESKIIRDTFIESKETEGLYLYEIKRYLNQNETYYDDNDEFFMEFIYIEIDYVINKENYITIFAINTIEYKD